MTLWVCNRCSTKFAVGLSYCPHCTSTDHREDGQDVAKITKAGGATNDADPTEASAPAAAEPPAAEPAPSASPAAPDAEAEQVAPATGHEGRPSRSRARNNGR